MRKILLSVRDSAMASRGLLNLKQVNAYTPARTKYWESHPGLTQIGERYLSRARIRKESDGLVFSVPTNFHLKAIMPWKEILEATLNEKIIAFEVSKDEAPAGALVQKLLKENARDRSSASDANGLGNHSAVGAIGNSGFRDHGAMSRQLSIQLAPANSIKDRVEREKARRHHAPTYIESPAFEVAHHMLRRWSAQLSMGSQVIWIYGAPGSGKTALLKQLNHWVPLEKRMEFMDVMAFLHEWRKAIDSNNTFSFIRKYRHETDVLVLENIDELRNKMKTQDELLFTLNALAERGASFAVSSSAAPQALKDDLDPQLYSRLLSGLVAELSSPDRVFKEKLWRFHTTQHGLANVPVDLVVLEKLFSLNLSTVGKVNAVFINAIARMSCAGKLTLQDIFEFEGVHSPALMPVTSSGMNPRQLIESVSKLCGLSAASVLGKSRRADVVLARKFVFLALSRMLGMTNTSIAHYAEKDPSTVCHALKSIEEDLVNFRHVSKQWNWICTELGQKDSPN